MGALDGVDLSAVGRWTVEVVDTTGSTNADLAVRARAGAPDWQALVAGEQTAGRGRLTRAWSSPQGTSISLSVMLRPTRPISEWGLIPLITGLGVARAVESLGAQAVLKWPNDVLLPADDERKVCGILAEVVSGPTPGVVVGVGVNVSQDRGEFPVDTGTSLRLVGVAVTRPQVVTAVLEQLAELWRAQAPLGWDIEDPVPVARAPQPVDNQPASAREACGKRVFIALAICMDERCEDPRYRNSEECVTILARKHERENR